MEINSAKFVISLPEYTNFPGIGKKEIAFAGRSNVGKSSLINSLCKSRSLAKTSGTPGKTRLINIFLINDSIHFVDLPGYGYAKVSKAEKERWAHMMDDYFKTSDNLSACILLVDLRHKPTEQDVQMLDFLRYNSIPYTIVATKADKLSRAQQNRAKMLVAHTLVVQPWEILLWSSVTGLGRDELLDSIEEHLNA